MPTPIRLLGKRRGVRSRKEQNDCSGSMQLEPPPKEKVHRFKWIGIFGGLKMAVPAQELRLRGARSTAELALAGTIKLVLDGVLRLDDVWAPTPPSTRGIIHLFKNPSTIFCD